MRTDVTLNGKQYEVEVSHKPGEWEILSVFDYDTESETDDDQIIDALYDHMANHMDIDSDLIGYMTDMAHDARGYER